MKKRALVKVRGCVGLGAWPLAAARAVAETVQSSMKKRALVKVRGCVGLGAWPLAAARLWRRRSSHPSGRAGRARVPCGARGLNQVGGRPVLARPDFHASSPELCEGVDGGA